MASDARQIIKERFDRSFKLRTEKAGLESRLDVLEEENQEAQNVIRERKAELLELEGSIPYLLAEQAARFERSFQLRTENVESKGKLTALEEEFVEVQMRIRSLVEEIDEIEMPPAEVSGAASAPRRGRGRPRKSHGTNGDATSLGGVRPESDLAAVNTAETPSHPPQNDSGQTRQIFTAPSLYVSTSTYLPAPILDSDHVQASRGGEITMLSKHHLTVVRLDNRWTQIWCSNCGDNSSYHKAFFTGLAGLHSHTRRTACMQNNAGSVTLGDVLRKCGRHLLSELELEDLRSGKRQIRLRKGGKGYDCAPIDARKTSLITQNQDQGSISTAPYWPLEGHGGSESDAEVPVPFNGELQDQQPHHELQRPSLTSTQGKMPSLLVTLYTRKRKRTQRWTEFQVRAKAEEDGASEWVGE